VPTITRILGLRAVIYFNDHRPAHVHVIGRTCEAVFSLHCQRASLQLLENYGFKRAEVARIKSALMKIVTALCTAWEDIHGAA
jgi:hypothetical protein